MKKQTVSVLILICILTAAGCGKAGGRDCPAAIMADGTLYFSRGRAVPAEVEESVIRYTVSYAEGGIPQKDGETNFDRDADTPYAVLGDGRVVVLIDHEWIEFGVKEPS